MAFCSCLRCLPAQTRPLFRSSQGIRLPCIAGRSNIFVRSRPRGAEGVSSALTKIKLNLPDYWPDKHIPSLCERSQIPPWFDGAQLLPRRSVWRHRRAGQTKLTASHPLGGQQLQTEPAPGSRQVIQTENYRSRARTLLLACSIHSFRELK